MAEPEVIIIGAGLAGLACALKLRESGKQVLLLEADEEAGGRVKSDHVDGFTLDHGFQVLLSAYPACRKVLDFENLKLGYFDPGARIQLPMTTATLSDPFREPLGLPRTILAPVGHLRDKLKIARLRRHLVSISEDESWQMENVSTITWLRQFGFSEWIIERFFRPFLSGIFLERNLSTSARMFAYVYRYFSLGRAALPAGGMGSIPRQLAAQLPGDCLQTGIRVAKVDSNRVTLEDGSSLQAQAIVVATDGRQAREWFPQLPERKWNGGSCYYFSTDESPLEKVRKLWLNATGKGRINHIAVPSEIAEGYAPEGSHLVSVNVVGQTNEPAPLEDIEAELRGHFGPSVNTWIFLRSYVIPRSLPAADPENLEAAAKIPASINGIHVCGDHLRAGSLDMAIASGRKTAESVLTRLEG